MATRFSRQADTLEIEAPTADLEGLIGYNLKRAYVIVRKDFRETLGEDGLSPRVFSALSLAVETPNITQAELARTMGIERSGLVAIVDELEDRDYLHRVQMPDDRRMQGLVPTAKGKRAYTAAIRAIRRHEDRVFGALSDQERQTLLSLLHKVRSQEDD